MLYKVNLLIPLFILKTHAGCSRCQCCARDGVQWYLSRKQSRHPRTATRVQLAASAAGRGDFSALFPAGRLWGPDTDSPENRRPAEGLLLSAAGWSFLRRSDEFRRRAEDLLLLLLLLLRLLLRCFSSCRMKQLPHRLPLRQAPPSEEARRRHKMELPVRIRASRINVSVTLSNFYILFCSLFT